MEKAQEPSEKWRQNGGTSGRAKDVLTASRHEPLVQWQPPRGLGKGRAVAEGGASEGGASEGMASEGMAEGAAEGDWRIRSRHKTVMVGILLCLNIGVTPPDAPLLPPSTPPTPPEPHPAFAATTTTTHATAAAGARLEAWLDPSAMPPAKSLEAIGRALVRQYEHWQPRARHRLALDPTPEEIRRLASSLRKPLRKGQDRLLLHYNGHGVPRPTAAGELWCFNKTYTQYMPVSARDLASWFGEDVVCVWDCSAAENLLKGYTAAIQQAKQRHAHATGSSSDDDNADADTSPTPDDDGRAVSPMVHLAACRSDQVLPCHAETPADLFTACLTTPIEASVRWFLSTGQSLLTRAQRRRHDRRRRGNATRQGDDTARGPLVASRTAHPPIHALLHALATQPPPAAHTATVQGDPDATLPAAAAAPTPVRIPGTLTDRRTPLGELNWIFTAVTDTIAWSLLPSDLFQRLYRQDLMLAGVMRNFLLAARVMAWYGCDVVSAPAVVDDRVRRHPAWEAWDLAVEGCLAQLPTLCLGDPVPPLHTPTPTGGYVFSAFFADALTAFEKWLEKAQARWQPSGSCLTSSEVPWWVGWRRSFHEAQVMASQHQRPGAPYKAQPASGVGSVSAKTPPSEGSVVARAILSPRSPPPQLPILLQVLLSQSHRYRALALLARFLALGPVAVRQALAVGIFPYVLKLLQSPAIALRGVLVACWARVVATDGGVQVDLVKERGYQYFTQAAFSTTIGGGVPSTPPSTVAPMGAERLVTRVEAVFVLAMFARGFETGKAALCRNGTLTAALEHLMTHFTRTTSTPPPECITTGNEPTDAMAARLRTWMCLLVGTIVDAYPPAKQMALQYTGPLPASSGPGAAGIALPLTSTGTVVDALVVLMTRDRDVVVRAAALYAMATLFSLPPATQAPSASPAPAGASAASAPSTPSGGNPFGEHGMTEAEMRLVHHMAVRLLPAAQDASPMVRRELVFALSRVVHLFPTKFRLVAYDLYTSHRRSATTTSATSSQATFRVGFTVYSSCWKVLLQLSVDPHPEVAWLAAVVVDDVHQRFIPQQEESMMNVAHSATVPSASMHGPSGAASSGFLANVPSIVATPQLPTSPSSPSSGKDRSIDAMQQGGGSGGGPIATTKRMLRRSSSLTNFFSGNSAGLSKANPAGKSAQTDSKIKFSIATGSSSPKVPSSAAAAQAKETPKTPLSGLTSSLPLSSTLFDYCQRYFVEPDTNSSTISSVPTAMTSHVAAAQETIDMKTPVEDIGCPSYIKRQWQECRNDRIMAKYSPSQPVKPYSEQIAILKGQQIVTNVLMHPYESLLIATGEPNSINVWDLSEGRLMKQFLNTTTTQYTTRITSTCLLNEAHDALLCVASDDGVVRVWRDVGSRRRRGADMVVSWRGIVEWLPPTTAPRRGGGTPMSMTEQILGAPSSMHSSVTPGPPQHQQPVQQSMKRRRPGTLLEWQQTHGMLLLAGDSPVIRCFDLEYEQCVQDIPIASRYGVTALSSEAQQGNMVVCGFMNGTVQMYDRRMPCSSTPGSATSHMSPQDAYLPQPPSILPASSQRLGGKAVATFTEHASWIVGCSLRQHKGTLRELVTADRRGTVRLWDPRKPTTSKMSMESSQQHGITAMAVHPNAPLIATGSNRQYVKVFDATTGGRVHTIRHHEGFLGQRMGPTSCLAFHTWRPVLACGGTDGIVAVFSSDTTAFEPVTIDLWTT